MLYLFLVLFLLSFYYYATRNHDYWKKRNIKHDRPIPLYGTHLPNLLTRVSITQLSVEMYRRFGNEKVIGYYRGITPELIVKDLDIIRRIMNVDFASFYPRGAGRKPEIEPMMGNIFHVDGDRWKLLRQRLTSAFTNSKLKGMFPLVVRCAEKLQNVCEDIAANGGECDARDLMARFTIEFIAACGFGIETDTINNEHSMFKMLGKTMFDITPSTIFRLLLTETFPELKDHVYVLNKKIDETIIELTRRIREQRGFKPSGRNDFIDLLLDLETKGVMRGESIEKVDKNGKPVEVEFEMDLTCIAAQVFVFLGAGFETSSSATSFTLHELAFHPEIQTEIQEELDRVLIKYDNKLCYDAIAEMHLLEMAFKEAMRKFPSLGVLNRICARKYTIPELNITIDPGVRILIPVQAIHMDEKYYSEPHEFRPSRFLPEEVSKRHKYSYLAFGDGPRACIGLRLGQMQSLAGLAAILHKFSVEPSESTRRHLEVQPRSNTVQSVKGVPLKLRRRK